MSVSFAKKIASLGLNYPLWLFDVDQRSWPRKLSGILPDSRPAKITGWFPWPWEYGTNLYRIDDPMPSHVIDTRQRDFQRLGDAAHVLEILQYDDNFGGGTFEIVFESSSAVAGVDGLETKDLDGWVFDYGHEGYVDSRRVVQIKRKWDDVPFWDRQDCWNLFDDGEARTYTSFGVASRVHNEGELVAAAGVHRRETGEKIRKAEFELMDGGKETVKGIILPRRHQVNHGIFLRGGPQSLENREILADTALEDAPWKEVEYYVHGKTTGPLWS